MANVIENRGPELFAVDVTFMIAAVIASLLRCYVRIFMVKAFGRDDWLMLFATCTFISYCSSSIIGVQHGTGRHHRDLPVPDRQKAIRCWWFCYLFYCLTMISSKISIGFFLLRVTVKKIHAWIIYAAMFISVVAGVVFFFVTLFQCHPISYFWNKLQPGQCISADVIVGLAFLYGTFSIISDFTFAILPAFLVWNLQLPRRTKIALVPLLAMGCIASLAVVARYPYLGNFRKPDFLWVTVDIAIWATVEQGLAITAGSLATLRPLLQIAYHRFGLSTKASKNSRAANYSYQSKASSNPLSSRRKGSLGPRDAYDLATFQQLEDHAPPQEEKEKVISPGWYQPSFARNNNSNSNSTKQQQDLEANTQQPSWPGFFVRSGNSSLTKMRSTTTDNDSEEELRAESSKGTLVERHDSQEMLRVPPKTFLRSRDDSS